MGARQTGSLHIPGQDECSIAQLRNGSLFAIMRSCPADKHGRCEGRRRARRALLETDRSQSSGAGALLHSTTTLSKLRF